MNLSWDELARGFANQRDFCKGYSLLYEAVCGYCAAIVTKRAAAAALEPDEKAFIQLLETELAARHFDSTQEPAILFLAALHAALLNGDSEVELVKRFYATVGGSYIAPQHEELLQALRVVCLKPSKTTRDFLRTQEVKTNEVSRGITWLLPAMVFDRAEPGVPITVIDLGCSLGLNLIADTLTWQWRVVQGLERSLNQVANEYENALILQQIDFGVESEVPRLLPPGALTVPNIVKRVGVDINPPRPDDPVAIAALRAFIWGDRKDRLERFDRALTSFKNVKPGPEINTADMIEAARSLHTHITPETKVLLVYNTVVTQYMTDEQYAVLHDNIIESFHQLPENVRAYWFELEPPRADDPDAFKKMYPLKAHIIREGHGRMEYVAHTEPHPQMVILLPVWDSLLR